MINKVILQGRLGEDAACENIDQPVKFSIATWESYRDEDEESGWKTTTTWHRITLWGKPEHRKSTADRLKKGMLVYLEGKIKTSKWTNNEGEERRSNDVTAQFVKVVPVGKEQKEQSNVSVAKPTPSPAVAEEEPDDLPF